MNARNTPRRTIGLLLAGIGTSVAVSASAQVAPPVPTSTPGGEREQRPLTLRTDRTTIGGQSLTDRSPRLPGVDYDGPDLTVPVAPADDLVRGQTVLGRSRPDYDPIGIVAGGFRIYPEISARVGYDSNIFSQTSGNGDAYGRLRGSVLARSDWGRHEAAFDGFVDERAYTRFTTESGITYNVRGAGRFDIGTGSSLNTSLQHGHVFIDRGATTEILQTRRPVRYNFTTADFGGRTERGQFTFDALGTLSRYSYEDAESPAGVFLSQRFRNFKLYRGQGEAGYSSGAGPAVFVSLAAEARRFDFNDIRIRDSDGVEILGGLRGDITPLLRGRLGVGYFRYNFKDPAIRTRSGTSFDVRLDYLVTPLTTINGSARRELKNVSSVTLPAALATSVALGVDHEVLRNLVVSAGGNFETADYVDSPLTVKRYGVHAGGFYLVNRRFRLDADLSYRRRDQNSVVSARNFDEVGASVGTTFRF